MRNPFLLPFFWRPTLALKINQKNIICLFPPPFLDFIGFHLFSTIFVLDPFKKIVGAITRPKRLPTASKYRLKPFCSALHVLYFENANTCRDTLWIEPSCFFYCSQFPHLAAQLPKNKTWLFHNFR